MTFPTREGSLKCVNTENTQEYLAMNTQRSDSAIGQVLKGLVGPTREQGHWEMGSTSEII